MFICTFFSLRGRLHIRGGGETHVGVVEHVRKYVQHIRSISFVFARALLLQQVLLTHYISLLHGDVYIARKRDREILVCVEEEI